MSTVNNGVRRNKIDDDSITTIGRELYENIFKVNVVDKGSDTQHYFYNTLNKVYLPENLGKDTYDEITLDRPMSWTYFSYKIYDTINLWWLLVLVNKPDYIFMAEAGNTYKYIKPEAIGSVLEQINR